MAARRLAPGGSELLALVQDAPRPTLSQRGRPLFAEDIQALFPTKSRWWINHKFMPSKKHKVGRDNYWFENEVTAAMDRDELEV